MSVINLPKRRVLLEFVPWEKKGNKTTRKKEKREGKEANKEGQQRV